MTSYCCFNVGKRNVVLPAVSSTALLLNCLNAVEASSGSKSNPDSDIGALAGGAFFVCICCICINMDNGLKKKY